MYTICNDLLIIFLIKKLIKKLSKELSLKTLPIKNHVLLHYYILYKATLVHNF